MRKSSWIVLALCGVLVLCLGFAYMVSRQTPQPLTKETTEAMVQQMQEAVKHKNINTIMSFVSPDPDTKVAGLDQDHIRRMLASAFHMMQEPRADVNNLNFIGGTDEATVDFDLSVHNDGPGQQVTDYKGHVTLQIRRVDVPHLMGLYHTREWRIVDGSQTGPDLTTWGDD
jgi:hypothetical protein